MKDPIMQFREEMGITDAALMACAKQAYDLLSAGRPQEAAAVSEGLVAADKKNAYYRTLYATALLRKREFKAALAVVDEGLTHSPGNKELSDLRQVLTPTAPAQP
jgi:hypothetical protein